MNIYARKQIYANLFAKLSAKLHLHPPKNCLSLYNVFWTAFEKQK